VGGEEPPGRGCPRDRHSRYDRAQPNITAIIRRHHLTPRPPSPSEISCLFRRCVPSALLNRVTIRSDSSPRHLFYYPLRSQCLCQTCLVMHSSSTRHTGHRGMRGRQIGKIGSLRWPVDASIVSVRRNFLFLQPPLASVDHSGPAWRLPLPSQARGSYP
jgi:hypothetical protein